MVCYYITNYITHNTKLKWKLVNLTCDKKSNYLFFVKLYLCLLCARSTRYDSLS